MRAALCASNKKRRAIRFDAGFGSIKDPCKLTVPFVKIGK
jgi:hypothetical protein